MIDNFIEEFQPGKQLCPIEWRPLLYKHVMWEVQLIMWHLTSKGDKDGKQR